MSDDTAPFGLTGGVLSGEQIRALILAEPPLITGYRDLEAQIQPNGFDLTLAELARFAGPGVLAAENAGRRLPPLAAMTFDADGFVDLTPGCYQIVYGETVRLPVGLMALGRPRSTVCRCGATIQTAVWDAGYAGRSASLLVVHNPAGFRLQHGARVTQLVFFPLARPAARGYAGAYQGEGIGDRGR